MIICERKIKKQKGTGTARAGSIKNPLFKGGGRVFGPTPRSYNSKLNKKVKNLAQFSALSDKAKAKDIVVIEDFDFKEPKTKNYINLLLNLGVNGEKTMLDVLIPVSKSLIDNLNETNISKVAEKINFVAKEGMLSTKDIIATKGRASFLCDRAIGHIDPGARSSQLAIEAIANQFINT